MDGSGSASVSSLNRQSAAVEIERGRTAASVKESEEGILETKRPLQDVYSWNPPFSGWFVERLRQWLYSLVSASYSFSRKEGVNGETGIGKDEGKKCVPNHPISLRNMSDILTDFIDFTCNIGAQNMGEILYDNT